MRSLQPRYAVIALALIGGASVSLFTGAAQASSSSTTTTTTPYQTGRANSGTPNSDQVHYGPGGQVISYGNSAIIYKSPSIDTFGLTKAQFIALGNALYSQNCASCHGVNADGVPAGGTPGEFPSLLNVGSATVDFWIESGRMPAANPRAVQAMRMPTRLNHEQALQIAAYLQSITHGANLPFIPSVNLNGGDVAVGASLFALNCAACHTITGGGDALAAGTYAPSLRHVPMNQIAMAIRTGPGNMPRFTGNLSDAQVRDIVKYVNNFIEHPQNPGGLGLGGLGPVAEGFVALALGVGLLALAGFWVGDRQ